MANTFKLKTKANVDASLVTVYTTPTSPSTTSVIIGLTISNVKGSSITADAKIITAASSGENGDDVHVVKDIPLPAGSSVEIMAGNKIILNAGDVLQVKGSTTNCLDAILSIMEIT